MTTEMQVIRKMAAHYIGVDDDEVNEWVWHSKEPEGPNFARAIYFAALVDLCIRQNEKDLLEYALVELSKCGNASINLRSVALYMGMSPQYLYTKLLRMENKKSEPRVSLE